MTDDETTALVEAAGAAFAYHYHRDRMNAISHLGNPKYSPITFALAKALTPAGISTPELEEVRSHSGRYGLDYGR